MDIKALDKALQEIANRRMELSKIDYNNPKYDDLEEQLHDLEDTLQDEYGDYLEGILQEVHDKHCPDNDVLYPIAYLAKTYQVGNDNEYSVAENEGVFVELEGQPSKNTKLVLLPNPPRIILNGGKEKQKVLWSAQ
ncbi:MAG TPA: hypothetical protein VK508_06540 [Cyclobacteriaceae bacterium]|nr:hypothetical protein [Cyclobacteriaceae bacterium]